MCWAPSSNSSKRLHYPSTNISQAIWRL